MLSGITPLNEIIFRRAVNYASGGDTDKIS
jgi:hypothetical protein